MLGALGESQRRGRVEDVDAMVEMGQRIRELMPSGMSQRQLAQRVGMTPDALSRALNGLRGLSPLEAASIARTLGADTHWLITGAPDPLALTVAARHSWDPQRRVRVNYGGDEDGSTLVRVASLYRAAYPQGPAASAELPEAPDALRDVFGTSFVREFADVVESRLGVDVIRIPGLTTDYSIRVGGRGVIVLATQSAWFRSNWSLAHELGHLALRHHNPYDSPRRVQRDEQAADRFAASLLLPSTRLAEVEALADERSTASLIWELGVSTEAVRNQMRRARRTSNPVVTAALAKTTPRLLRDNLSAITDASEGDPIVQREQLTSARRFPVGLLSALQLQTELGATSPALLAWALDVPVDDLDFPEPDEGDAADHYERMLSERPSTADWSAWLSSRSDS